MKTELSEDAAMTDIATQLREGPTPESYEAARNSNRGSVVPLALAQHLERRLNVAVGALEYLEACSIRDSWPIHGSMTEAWNALQLLRGPQS